MGHISQGWSSFDYFDLFDIYDSPDFTLPFAFSFVTCRQLNQFEATSFLHNNFYFQFSFVVSIFCECPAI